MDFEAQMQLTLDKFPTIKVEMRYQDITNGNAGNAPKPPKAEAKHQKYVYHQRQNSHGIGNIKSKTASVDFFKHSSRPTKEMTGSAKSRRDSGSFKWISLSWDMDLIKLEFIQFDLKIYKFH